MRTKQIGLKAFTDYEVMCKERVKRHYVMLLSRVNRAHQTTIEQNLYDTTAD